jgi:hypothetical protein
MYRQRLQSVFRLAHFPVSDYGDDHFVIKPTMVGHLRTLSYLEQWRTALTERWYHVRLEDHSILLFDETEGRPSYSYIQCPLEIESMREFLNRTGRECSVRNIREAQEEYENLWETAELKKQLTPIRYDYDPTGYVSGSHPLGHIHIGLGNSVRIAVRRSMSPMAFSLFVMRQMYPSCWRLLLEYSDNCGLPNLCRNSLPLIDQEHWQPRDEIEAYLV